jgi:hypothetical protein
MAVPHEATKDLIIAINDLDVDGVCRALECKTNINGRDPQTRTPLIRLAARGVPPEPRARRERFFTIARVLIEAGADPNAVDAHGWTALHYCAKPLPESDPRAAYGLAKHLIHSGADPVARTSAGITAVELATRALTNLGEAHPEAFARLIAQANAHPIAFSG